MRCISRSRWLAPIHHTFTRTSGGRAHIYSFAKELSKVRLLLILGAALTTSRKYWSNWALTMSGGKSTLIKGWGNFSCSRLHNIYLAHSLLGPRDNLFSGEFHLLQCQKLVRLAEYPVRKTRMQTKYSTKYPLPRLQVFFFSFDHKLHVGAASAKPKYNSPSINTFLISSASVLATVATWIFAFNEIAHAHAGISNLLMTRMLCHTSTAYMWKSVSYCGLVAIGSFRGVAYR